MNNPWNVIQELEADNSRLVKEEIVAREASAGNDEFFAGCRLALDAMTTFGVKQVDTKEDASGLGLDWTNFAKLADDLSNRTLTIGVGLTSTTATTGSYKITTFTAGSDTITIS